ncbi:MAG: type II toxin-antitoxin system PemK/MazF family toxin [Nitrospinae bacterium]|nr:type II toxin-antitoxin system PemK/MazF family toxin [Nitrospinota bacterium]
MKSGKAIYKQREIVLTRFPFSNLTDFKVRPVLIISKDSYNCKYADVIVCAMTTNLEESEYGITITTEGLEEGHLKLTSKVRMDAITNIEQDIIIKKIGRLKIQIFKEVLIKINTLFAEK